MNQTKFGAIGGVTKKTQMLYEGGARMPDAAYLRGIAQIGVDVQYILIGLHSANLDEAMLSEEFVNETSLEHNVSLSQHVTMGAVAMKPDESALLENYRHLPSEGQKAIREVCAALAYQQATKPDSPMRKSAVEFTGEYHGKRTPVEFGDEMKTAPGKKRKDDAA